MDKKLILVASPPGCGKTYTSELIASSVDHITYLDKDDLRDLLGAAFAVSGNKVDMDGPFYQEHLRPAEYDTILNIAFSALRFEDLVILNAPFGKEVRDPEYMQALKKRANQQGAQLLLIWVDSSPQLCYERMKKRNHPRDTGKLANWDAYIKNIDFSAPHLLAKKNAVDELILFNADNEAQTKRSLEEALKRILD